MKYSAKPFSLVLLLACVASVGAQTRRTRKMDSPMVSREFVQIMSAEDNRRWDDNLKKLIAHDDPKIRKRAVLAAGRIGAEDAVPVLAETVLMDRDVDVRQMAAFALGEIESGGGAYALTEVLKVSGVAPAPAIVRARAVEGLGKIVAAVTSPNATSKPDAEWLDITRAAIVTTLRFEEDRGQQADRLTTLLALTAVLRARPEGAGKLVAQFLDRSDPRIVAEALNTLTRLRLKDGNDKARGLLRHNDPIVRANAARVLGATEDKPAYEALLDRALHDADERVAVSAIRALASLKDARAVPPLIERGEYLLKLLTVSRQFSIEPRNQLLEIVTVLGRLLPNTDNAAAIGLVKRTHQLTNGEAPEVEIAFARMNPALYQTPEFKSELQLPSAGWRRFARRAQGLAAINEVIVSPAGGSDGDRTVKDAQAELHDLLRGSRTPALAIPDILQAHAAYKPAGIDDTSRNLLTNSDVIVRATAAQILGTQPPSDENARALIGALPRAMRDPDNDAALAILDALAKQKKPEANEAIKTALASRDHLLRRRAVSLLKTNGAGDFSARIGTVQTQFTEADYRRALARAGKKPTATIVTNKGSFTIEFLAEDAPLTVDNFLQLAKRRYFNGQTIPRVVPNFVVQAGDPRGDQNGGPGYTIRCELNEVMFDRAVVGMALSGKDTGGSQWFVTHSPQPHLDGGYTVFGRVTRGMEVVDRIARGDRIVRVVVNDR